MEGYIFTHRKMKEWEWYKASHTFHLFMHLLLTANHQDGKWRGIEVKKGQLITGLNSLVSDTGMSKQSVRTSLNRLKSTHEITLNPTRNYTIITILNWERYQATNTPDNTRLTHDQHTINTPANNKQENKNEKNEKKRKEEGVLENASPPTEKSKSKKGTRLPDDWELQQEDGDWAVAQGLTGAEVIKEADVFKDYWLSQPGAKGVKLDWIATWRNWVRRKLEYKNEQIQRR